MMIIINAWKSLTRSKGRNSLIGIIILAITLSASVALAIKSTANKAKTSGLDSQTVTGTISVDRQKLMEGSQTTSDSSSDNKRPDMSKMQELMAQYPDLSLDDLQKYADSASVKKFYFTASAALNGTDTFEPYSTSTSTTSSSDTSTESADQRGPGMPGSEGGSGDQSKGQSMSGLSTGDFSVTAASDESALSDFVSGTSKVSDGEMIDLTQSNNEILISKDLANFNNLKVGDTVTLTNPNLETETYSFNIKGIYTTSSSTTDSGFMQFSNAQDPVNMIYMSYDTLEAITKTSTDSATTSTDDQGNETTTALTHNISGTFVFSSQKNYKKFETELREKGLSDYYTLSSSDVDSYESSLVPLENLSKFATTFLYVILAVGAIILVVLNIFNIRERKYEIGVLTAIGIKKWKVALQFVVESLIITLAAVIIGASVGSIISVPISNNLLQSQIASQESEQSQQQTNFGRPGDAGEGNAEQGGDKGGGPSEMGGAQTDTADYLDSINATLDIKILGQLIGIGLLLTILSSLVGIVFVLRYDPLKILSSRS